MNRTWNKSNVLVTGATGFLGSWIVKDLLKKGAQVTIMLRDDVYRPNFNVEDLHGKINVVTGSIVDIDTVRRVLNKYSIDTIFHTAAQSQVLVAKRSPIETFESNIKGTWNILEAAREFNVERTISVSSDKAYGSQNSFPYVENMSMNGKFPYDVSKSCADLISRSYFSTYKLPVTVVRTANLYGGGDYNFDRLIPGTIKRLLQNEIPIVNSNATRDYIYIDDAVRGYMMIAENMDKEDVVGHAFNMGSGKGQNPTEVIATIIKLMEKDIEPFISLGERTQNEIDVQYLSSEKINTTLGWKQNYSFEEGLKNTIDWYTKNLNTSSL